MTKSYRFINGQVLTCSGDVNPEEWCLETSDEGLISYVGPESSAPQLEGRDIDVIDLMGKTIMPGLIDAHMHLGSTGDGVDGWIYLPRSYRFIKLVGVLRTLLDAGVTTVRDMGGLDSGVRRAVEDGLVPGPRLQVAISLLTHTGGHADGVSITGANMFPSMFLSPPEMPVGCIVDSDEEVIKGVRKIARYGADFFKVSATGGPGALGGQADVQGLTEHQIRLVVEEATRLGKTRVAAHAMGQVGLKAAVKGGVTSIEHGWEIDDETCDLMIEKSTWLVPTLSGAHHFKAGNAAGDERHNPGRGLVYWGEVGLKGVAKAIANGVPIAMGSDLGAGGAGTNGKELKHLVDLGMTPEAALIAATRNAAELMDISSEVGTLEVGKRADLIVVDGNPITEIAIMGDPDRIQLVMKDGVVEKDQLV